MAKKTTCIAKTIWKLWEHKSWGDSIFFWDFDARKITGHYLQKIGEPPRLKVGDALLAEMESGKIMAFEIIELEYKSDPADLFYGKVKDLGYVEDQPS